jgi:hypothetical protein
LPPDASPRLCYSEAVRFAGSLLVVVTSLLSVAAASCGSDGGGGDPHSNPGIPAPGGKDKRIKDVADPGVDGHAGFVSQVQQISGAVVVAVDKFDETADGKSKGTIYVQDLGSKDPYSGITLFSPTFNPGNLSIGPGDVLDLNGQYTESQNIGATVTFAPGVVLPQISKPVATFRYETQVLDPVDIDVNDLADFTKGRRWLGMLVRVKNVTLQQDAAPTPTSNRVSAALTAGSFGKCDAPFPKPPTLINALFDLEALGLKKGTTIASITGVVGFFCNIQLAPRSPADIVVQ